MTRRRRPAHYPTIEMGDRPVIVLLTVCVDGRRRILANRSAVDTIVTAWRTADAWAVGRYVVMPDHVHLFCAPRQDVSLHRWVHYWKSLTSRYWPTADAQPLWQRDHWDTQLRSLESYEEKWAYVCGNPVRHGLVATTADWPYAGEMTRLEWGNETADHRCRTQAARERGPPTFR